MNAPQPPRPSWFHLLGAGVVLVGCELFLAAAFAILCMRDSREIIGAVLPPALLLIGITLFVAWKQYQAIFQRNRDAATTITQLLVFVVVMLTIPFVDYTGMLLGTGNILREGRWYMLVLLYMTALFVAIANWTWSNRLRASQTVAIPLRWRWSLTNMLAVMTILGVQFAIAGILRRWWGG
ncbi:hypothetical protein [Anatilimnocola floriformis]|uniref:hypothetical protein n=1 Tax=Anatilimnocola floriformis TaxID=2948575 RepID=UPI0020C2D85C|nr:hypothetical protein [Anatilimnocola floriformis]